MKFNRTVFWRTLAIFAILDACIALSGCTTAWTTEAANIISLLVPAIQSVLAILTAFGLGISPAVMTSINSWAADAEKGLVQVKGLIDQYNAAEATAKPGLLEEIQTYLSVISSNLASLLPTIHVTDPDTQAKIEAVVQAVASEIAALINLVPAIQGKVTSHAELKALMAALKTPDEFKKDFNEKATVFGPQYSI